MAAFLIALALLAGEPQQAPTQPPKPAAAPAQPKFSTKTPLTDLMANAQAKDVLRKHLPEIVQFLDGAGASQAPAGFNVESLAAIPRAGVTPEKIQAINEDLGKL